jgi:hypothetical protein
MLRGMLGGAAIGIALPPLEALWNSTGTAYADGTLFPRRFGIFFWGNGVIPAKWVPTTEGPDWTPSEQLMPLASIKQYVTVVSGLSVLATNSVPHGSGPAGLLSGDNLAGNDRMSTVTGPTIDQLIATEFEGQTRFRSLEIGVQRSDFSYSWAGPNENNPPETSPINLFNRLFVDGFRAPGDTSMPDPRIGLRRSVLDAVTSQAARLRTRLGSADRVRLESHLDAIRTLEGQLDRLQQTPVNLAACMLPPAPMNDYPDIEGRAQMAAISHAMSDLLAMALACDQTRVFFNMYSQPVNNVLFGTAPAGHHQLTHDEPGDQPQVNAIVQLIMQDFAYFLEALRRVTEGTETLLDHCAVLATTDTSLGKTHSLDNYPILIAGSGCGRLRMGMHYHSPGADAATKVSLTLLRAMGLSVASFGVGAGNVSQGLTAIEI